MENTPMKRKWRLNVFDVIFIICIIIAAILVIRISRGSDGGILTPTAQEPVLYTILFERMIDDSALLISSGDELVDKIENRLMGTVVSVEVGPSMSMRTDQNTGERRPFEQPGALDALVTVRAYATITDNQISINGFIVRVGSRVSVNGPLYNGIGFIADIERGDAE